jgi:hypothetical protein
MTAPRVPSGLQAAGRRLWREVVAVYELRPDELLLLEKACRTADDAARLDAAVREAPLTVTGSTGQTRHNPLLNESRQTRALLASLLKQLALPDEPAEASGGSSGVTPGSQRAYKAARARWGNNTGSRRHGA